MEPIKPEEPNASPKPVDQSKPKPPIPRGVFRFHSHEEADAWLEQYDPLAPRPPRRTTSE